MIEKKEKKEYTISFSLEEDKKIKEFADKEGLKVNSFIKSNIIKKINNLN